jgi:hypothetical protein
MDHAGVSQMTRLTNKRLDPRLVTIEGDSKVRVVPTGDIRAPDNTGGGVVTTHGVKRQPHCFGIGTH